MLLRLGKVFEKRSVQDLEDDLPLVASTTYSSCNGSEESSIFLTLALSKYRWISSACFPIICSAREAPIKFISPHQEAIKWKRFLAIFFPQTKDEETELDMSANKKDKGNQSLSSSPESVKCTVTSIVVLLLASPCLCVISFSHIDDLRRNSPWQSLTKWKVSSSTGKIEEITKHISRRSTQGCNVAVVCQNLGEVEDISQAHLRPWQTRARLSLPLKGILR